MAGQSSQKKTQQGDEHTKAQDAQGQESERYRPGFELQFHTVSLPENFGSCFFVYCSAIIKLMLDSLRLPSNTYSTYEMSSSGHHYNRQR